jgi:hypothetical protein
MRRRIFESGAFSHLSMHSSHHAFALVAMAVLPLGVILADNVTTATKTPTTKKGSAANNRAGATASRKTSSTRKGTAATAGRTTASRQTWRPRQVQPTPERYKEIQQALVSKGYLSGEPSGAWNQESADALRRFQQDQNINASGKIDSLSLIALGLGPKRGPAPTPPGHPEPKPEIPPQPPATN